MANLNTAGDSKAAVICSAAGGASFDGRRPEKPMNVIPNRRWREIATLVGCQRGIATPGGACAVRSGGVHVSPSGSDGNPGTASKPFRTIQRAGLDNRQRLRDRLGQHRRWQNSQRESAHGRHNVARTRSNRQQVWVFTPYGGII